MTAATLDPPIPGFLAGGLTVVRDDLVPGGTKRRFIDPYLTTIDASEVVYASPAYGYAQIALAIAAAAAGKRAVIFTAARRHLHPRTLEAARHGAWIVEVKHGYLTVVTARAREYAADQGAHLVPFGVDVPGIATALIEAAHHLPEPSEVWVAAGSGTLTRALQQAWPNAAHHAVRVGAEPDAGAATVHTAPEKFERDAKHPPPYPSCSNYDAKVWQFASRLAQPGALIWNVAA